MTDTEKLLRLKEIALDLLGRWYDDEQTIICETSKRDEAEVEREVARIRAEIESLVPDVRK